jgi:bile acid:Na+ symporter, BASS family
MLAPAVVTTVLLPAALAFIMWTLGLGLTVADFARVAAAPKGVAIGLANLLVLSPLLAFGVASAYGLAPAFAVGLVLLGASPGGTMANLMTHLARGRVALSVTMTAVSSVVAFVTVPLFLTLAINRFDAAGLSGDVEMAGIVARVFAVTILPLAAGMAIRARAPDWVAEHGGVASRAALAAFVVVVAGAVISEWDKVTGSLGDLAAAALTLNVAAMALSFGLARLARLDGPSATAIALELGVHNAALAIAVGAAVDPALSIPAAVYSVFMFVTAGLFARLVRARNGAEAAAG